MPKISGNIHRKSFRIFKGRTKYDGRLVGLLGTLIFHLLAAIIFMSFKIRELKQQRIDNFTMEFEQIAPESKPEDQKIQLPATSVEKILQGDNEMMNIARNLSNRSEQTINPQDYIDRVKEELIKSGQLSKDNYIDDQKKLAEQEDENIAAEPKVPETKREEKPSESQQMAANYKGPTRIYYDLKGRNHLYLPIPIYMCEGSGKVALTISVDQKGEVEEAKVIPGESTTNDPCLIETAISTALSSRFNPDINSPKIQRGTLTYLFVAQ